MLLENGIEDNLAHRQGPASAFAHTYVWATVAALLAIIPAVVLGREEARARREGKASEQPPQAMAA